jgi:hypothetical protein
MTDKRLTVWEMVHQLIRVLEAGGEGAAAALVTKLGSQAGNRPRTLLPPLHPVRTEEARQRGDGLQRPGAKLARNHPTRARQHSGHYDSCASGPAVRLGRDLDWRKD